MKKTSTRLADGRELIYYDSRDDAVRSAQDQRPLPHSETLSELRHDPVLDEWVVIAAHRQGRIYHPPADECPLCPSRDGRLSEIPESDYEVVVFENRFPSLAAHPHPEQVSAAPPHAIRPAAGRCEVVCFTPEHDASFADLSPRQVGTVLEAWTDRTAELSTLPDVEQVFCFENRGVEIGVTLEHSHGQIYAYPFVTPRTERMIAAAVAHRVRTGRNLFEDQLEAERRSGERIVVAGEHWTAFVPFAAHWPYEVHVYPNRRVADLLALDEAERTEFAHLYLDLLQRFDLLFTADEAVDGVNSTPKASSRTPYIAAWHQAPVRRGADRAQGADELALHMELFTIRRTVGKLKFLAGSESGMDVFINDVAPENAARRLREVKA
ncbi:galactose-1-phosphate uridylyltransferase [Streptacidiphilus anmyonensis]|uniref:galactose-1-phosphate uridylyltransferase n=1 Tax=Streptacidiphilus anmyonensis TaxID=405782 RepID=UPI0005A648F1|nr:galactose-1-phosphate uridylyltransferase [Streptacidiphilus anmyonensis]